MQLEIKAQIQIAKSPEEVYNAIVNPEQMRNYFISNSTGPMIANTTIQWQFPEFDMKVPVKVGDLKPGEYISYYWDEADDKQLLVEMNLVPAENNSTHIIITEKAMDDNEAGIAWLKRNTEGWANFLACLKAWLEFGINLRKGAFDFMRQHSN